MTRHVDKSEFPIEKRDHFCVEARPFSAAMWAMCAYMALYVIRPWESLSPELALLRFERSAYIVILLSVLGTTGLRYRLDGPLKGLAIFVAALCISAVNAYNPGLAWSGADALYVYLTKLLGAVLIIAVVRTRCDLMTAVILAVAVIFVFAGKSLWEYSIHGAGRWSMGVTRLTGINQTFGHPNDLCAVLVPILPWWLFVYRSRVTLEALWPPHLVKWSNWFLTISICTFVACILLSGSRAGFAGLIAFGLLSWFHARGSRLKVAFVIGVAIIVGMYSLDEEHTQRIRSLWDDSAAVAGGEESKEGRIYAFEAGLRMFARYPITGVGMGNFGFYRMGRDDGSNLEAHSIPAELLGETGIIGSAAFMYFLWTLFKSSRQLNRAAVAVDDDDVHMLSGLGTAMRHSMFLLLLLGTGGHLAYFFTWVWIAAFLSCALTIEQSLDRDDPFTHF